MTVFPKAMDELMASWQTDPLQAREAFKQYADFLAAQEGVDFDFKARPGVSYSLRAHHKAQQKRELFVLVDIIDDEPESRWLSVCFYADMINDPDELGDFVPQGLMGEDACCFNLDSHDPDMQTYIAARLEEAASKATRPAE